MNSTGNYVEKPTVSFTVNPTENSTEKPIGSITETPRINEPEESKQIVLDLPIDEFDFHCIEAEVLFRVVEDDIGEIESRLSQAEREIEKVHERINVMEDQAIKLRESAVLVGSKLKVLEDAVDSENAPYVGIEFLVNAFSFLVSMFALLWNRISKKDRYKS